MKNITIKAVFALWCAMTAAAFFSCSTELEDLRNLKDNAGAVETENRNTDTAYRVEHYQQNKNDDGYTLVAGDTQNLAGITGAQTTAAARTYTGFTAQTVAQSVIAADGSTVVKIYYTRNIITLTFNAAGGSWSDGTADKTVQGRYGAAVAVTEPAKAGYKFSAWNPAVPSEYPASNATYTATWAKEGNYTISYQLDGGTNDGTNPASYNVETATITLAAAIKTGYTFAGWYSDSGLTVKITQIAGGSTGNMTLYAKWTANTDTAYRVEHYQQNKNDDGYTLVAGDTQNLAGITGAQTTAAARTYTGFTAQTVAQSVIAADGSTVVKIYYTRNIITLTFNAAGGSWSGGTDDKTVQGRYGAAVAVTEPAKTGYKFSAWNPAVPSEYPASNATYTATWKAAPVTSVALVSGDVTITSSGSTFTVTPPDSADYSYAWYFNSKKQDSTSVTCTVDTAGLSAGCYELLVTATDQKHGMTRSANYTVTVK